ncbi:MAG: N-6 DNA methylase [Candidatus Hodarchaeales archaeon]|jgi:hypothetical protein
MIEANMKKTRHIKEFGDFQTPKILAQQITTHLKDLGISPQSIIEPTCGFGSFVNASIRTFPNAKIFAIDINPKYVNYLQDELDHLDALKKVEIQQADFFNINWQEKVEKLKKPILILGNPPWVTSSEMGLLQGNNIPQKSNIHEYQGLDAITGKSNFDISEWMIIELLKSMNGHLGTLAMLCKASVARKVLKYIQKTKLFIHSSELRLIDAKEHFNSSVDAGLFTCFFKPGYHQNSCQIYQNLESKTPIREIGFIKEKMIGNLPLYRKWEHLQGNSPYIWRSGIKHDCAKVMELRRKGDHLFNGFNEELVIEKDHLYPMLKSSDLANNRISEVNRWMIVPQRFIGEETLSIKANTPLTWNYLEKHADLLSNRSSSVYKNRPKFSIFGVGEYSFSLWKVAISGFYKDLKFRLLSPYLNNPVVLDDTCYFIPLQSLEEAAIIFILLNHQIAKDFFESIIFWDAKRPITKNLLQMLDIAKLFDEIGQAEILDSLSNLKLDLNEKFIVSILKRFKETS